MSGHAPHQLCSAGGCIRDPQWGMLSVYIQSITQCIDRVYNTHSLIESLSLYITTICVIAFLTFQISCTFINSLNTIREMIQECLMLNYKL